MAKIRKDLVGSVLVILPGESDPTTLVAGDTVPDGVELGDHVLAPEKDAKEPKAPKSSKKTTKTASAPATPDALESAAVSATRAAAAGSLVVPPLVGAGSSTDAWRAYAVKATEAVGLKLDIAADAKRGDIVEALKGAGIATE